LQPRLRLLAVHLSGHVDIITFVEDVEGPAWRTEGEAANAEAISNPLQHGSFIVDARTGALLGGDRERYFLMTQDGANKEARCLSGYIQSTQIVERMGAQLTTADRPG
jgi:hypothetical protein